jgi:hypothetical protein
LGVHAYTIVSRAYVPHARVLARSFAEHHPDGQFWALLIDDVDEMIDEDDEPFQVLRLSDLDVEPVELHRMAMLFGGRIIAAIKPWVFTYLLQKGLRSTIYIDSDFMIFDSLEPMAAAAADHGVVVVPHVLTPIPHDGRLPNETTVLGVGVYNAGCFAVGPSGDPFLRFMKERLRRECHTDVPGMRVNEQRWLDFVPALFDHHVLRDFGVDVAPWNIHERPITKTDAHYFAASLPLRAFHFSGFDPRLPDVLSARDYWDQPRVPMDDEPALAALCAKYRVELEGAGYERHNHIPFAFDFLADGTPIYASLRRLYANALLEAEAGGGSEPPDPFDEAQVDAFRKWAQDAYSDAGERVPDRLIGDRTEGSRRSTDWMGAMAVGEAGVRHSTGVVHITPDHPGVVMFGPNALVDAGYYRVGVEFRLGDRTPNGTADSNVLLVEVLLDGYPLAWVSIDERGDGSQTLDFVIPKELQEIALSAGVQVRIRCLSETSGTLNAVLVERMGEPKLPSYGGVPSEWLSAMSVGDVGERSGSSVFKRPGRHGTMAAGPQWRLDGGRYRAEFALRDRAVQGGDGSTVVALLEAVVHGYVLAFQSVTRADLKAGRAALEFELGGRWVDHRYTRVELKVRAQAEVDALLESVSVRQAAGSGISRAPGEGDWLPALWATDIAVRVGTEIHSIDGQAGVLAHGPGWRLPPGRYRFLVDIDFHDDYGLGSDPSTMATIQVNSDGTLVAERSVSSSGSKEQGTASNSHLIDFEVVARRVPPPLLEQTPEIDLRFVTEGRRSIRVRSAVLSRLGADG